LTWKRLFKKFNFFGAYPHFVMITILAVDEELQNRWLGFAESKIRHFTQKRLEVLSKEQGG
jgi:poly(A) polymerase Pap1